MKRNENTIEKKNLKKKILMVTGLALLLGLVGYTGGSTYAKYVTSAAPVSQTATVAKWGYTVSVDGTKFLGNQYVEDGTANEVSVLPGTTGAGSTVTINGSSNLVAPGATGSFELHVNGSAEVLAELSLVATCQDVYLNDYHPIAWTVEALEGSAALDLTGADDVVTTQELADGLEDLSDTYAPGTTVNLNYRFTWSWAFESSNDELDTQLGTLANNNSLSSGTHSCVFAFGLTVSVEQLAE